VSGVGCRVVTTDEHLDGVEMRVDDLVHEFLEPRLMVSDARRDRLVAISGYPIVNAYASAPGSRKVMSSVRSRIVSFSRTSWYRRPS
jgi:hypothetical protein